MKWNRSWRLEFQGIKCTVYITLANFSTYEKIWRSPCLFLVVVPLTLALDFYVWYVSAKNNRHVRDEIETMMIFFKFISNFHFPQENNRIIIIVECVVLKINMSESNFWSFVRMTTIYKKMFLTFFDYKLQCLSLCNIFVVQHCTDFLFKLIV